MSKDMDKIKNTVTNQQVSEKTKSSYQSEPFEVSKPLPLVNQIRKSMADSIVAGKLKPGQRLREKELQELFGVSRAPIREAIRLLEADDLITLDAFKKRYVRRITRDYLTDIVPVAACLEGFAARLCIEHITEDQISELQQINQDLKQGYDSFDPDRCASLNFNFHRIFLHASNNRELVKGVKAVTKPISWFWITQLYYKSRELIQISFREHNKIIKALRDKDAVETERHVREHILNSFKRSVKIIEFDDKGDLIL